MVIGSLVGRHYISLGVCDILKTNNRFQSSIFLVCVVFNKIAQKPSNRDSDTPSLTNTLTQIAQDSIKNSLESCYFEALN